MKFRYSLSVLFLCIGTLLKAQRLNTVASKELVLIDTSRPFRLPMNNYVCTLPFFCKKEVQIEKVTKVHVLFRLGSPEYTDYLEQKGH